MVVPKAISNRLVLVIAISVLFVVINVLAYSMATRISPKEMTYTAMTETEVRMENYLQQNQSLPKSLDDLPMRRGYMNRTTDGWDHPLKYSHEGDKFTLTSFGKDGAIGGSGENVDIVREYHLANGQVEVLSN